MIALPFGALGGVRTMCTPAVASHCSTALLHFGSRSHNDRRPSDNRPVSPAAQALDHERLVRVRRASDHLNPPRLHIQQKRHVVRHQSTASPDVGGEEVGRDERWPMRLEEGPPGRRALTTGRKASPAQNDNPSPPAPDQSRDG
jgi:hypothetical protein